MQLLDGPTSPVHALAFAPDGRLAAGDRGGTVTIWDMYGNGGELGTDSREPPAAVSGLAFSPDGSTLVVGGRGWATTGPAGVVLDPDRKAWGKSVGGLGYLGPGLLAVGFGDRGRPEGGELVLVDLETGFRRQPRWPAAQGVRAVATLPGKKLVAWVEWGRRLFVWDIAKADRVTVPLAAEPRAVALSPDGDRAAVAVDNAVRVIDPATKREVVALPGHTARVTAVAFTPDGGTIATGSWDGTVRLWDARSGRPRAAFDWPTGKVYALAVAADGLRLAAGGEAGTVAVIDLE
jgi:WD40 repeat protein